MNNFQYNLFSIEILQFQLAKIRRVLEKQKFHGINSKVLFEYALLPRPLGRGLMFRIVFGFSHFFFLING